MMRPFAKSAKWMTCATKTGAPDWISTTATLPSCTKKCRMESGYLNKTLKPQLAINILLLDIVFVCQISYLHMLILNVVQFDKKIQ